MSLFTVNKNTVIIAANNALKSITKKRIELFEIAVKAKMNRLFFKPKSREEAIEMVKKDSKNSSFTPWKLEGWATEIEASKLLDACETTGLETVQLDTDDASFVKEWYLMRK
jgi:hypothetical protein